MHFFCGNIWSCREKAVLLHRSPGNSSPRYDAGEESGFFIFMAKNELEILTNTLRRLRNRIFHQEAICWDLFYLTCLHDNLVTVLGWMNADMPKWLASIDPFDTTCEDIRKEMEWK